MATRARTLRREHAPAPAEGPAETLPDLPLAASGKGLDVALSSVAPQDELAGGMERRRSSPASTASERLGSDTDMSQNSMEQHNYKEAPGEAADDAGASTPTSTPTPTPTHTLKTVSSMPKGRPRSRDKPRPRGKKKRAGSRGQLADAAARTVIAGRPQALFKAIIDTIRPVVGRPHPRSRADLAPDARAVRNAQEDPGSPSTLLLVLDTEDRKSALEQVPDRVVGESYVPKKFDRTCGKQREPNNPFYRTWSWLKFIRGQKGGYDDAWGKKPDKNARVYIKAVLQALERAGISPVRHGALTHMQWSKIKKLPSSEAWVLRLCKTKCNARAFEACLASLCAPQPLVLSGEPQAAPCDESVPCDELPLVASAEGAQEGVHSLDDVLGGSRAAEDDDKMQASDLEAQPDTEVASSLDSFWDDFEKPAECPLVLP